MTKTVAVTGAAGALGRKVVEVLSSAGWRVVGIDLAAVPAENVHAHISFVVSRKQKINTCVSDVQTTNADLRKKLRQERLRKHQPSFWSKHIETETRFQQKKYGTRSPGLRSAGNWIQRG